MIGLHHPEPLSTTRLIQEARKEIEQFIQHVPEATTASSYELFRRALVLHDDYAWVGIYELYRYVVGSWIIRQCGIGVISLEEQDALVNFAFAKLSKSVSPTKFADFRGSVPALLAYLKRCAETVTIDYLRANKVHLQIESLDVVEHDALLDDTAESVLDRLAEQEVWKILCGVVESEEERLVLVTIIVLGWPPRDLYQLYQQLFPSVEDVYRIRRNVTERLRRNRVLRDMLSEKARPTLCSHLTC